LVASASGIDSLHKSSMLFGTETWWFAIPPRATIDATVEDRDASACTTAVWPTTFSVSSLIAGGIVVAYAVSISLDCCEYKVIDRPNCGEPSGNFERFC
jgi:hypothetical protein